MTKNTIFVDYQDDQSSILYNTLLESGKDILYCKYLPWDTDFFGRPCYLLDISKSRFSPSEKIKLQIEHEFKDSFITAKIETGIDFSIIYFLQQCGFYYIDTEVELQLTKKVLYTPVDERIRFEEKLINSDLPYEELGSVFELTRFHTEPNIANSKADELWINYLKTYNPTPNNRIFVAYYDGNACGVILSNRANNRTVVFFMSVLSQFQNKSIGSAIMQYSLEKLEADNIYTETQVKNLKALNFYIKNGFCFVSKTMTVLHRWN